jgi:hypothetical protein
MAETDHCLHCALIEAFETWRAEHGNVSESPDTTMVYSSALELSALGQFISEVIGMAGCMMPEDKFNAIVDGFLRSVQSNARKARIEARSDMVARGESHAHH